MTGEQQYRDGVGEWIKLGRSIFEVDQDELARAIGFSRSSVSRWETGATTPSAYAMRQIKRYFRELGSPEGSRA